MIYLNVGFFKPMLILLSIIILPITIVLFVLNILDFRIESFILTLIIFAIYILSVFGAYKFSKNKNFYLKSNEDGYIEIKYPNISDDNLHFEIMTNAIIKIEYYKISSFKAWCMLYNTVLPQCAYITYIFEGKEMCKHIGYPNYKEINGLCVNSGIDFVIK